MWATARQAVAPGGTLVGIGHALRNLTDGVGGPPAPDILWTEERLRTGLADLTILELGAGYGRFAADGLRKWLWQTHLVWSARDQRR